MKNKKVIIAIVAVAVIGGGALLAWKMGWFAKIKSSYTMAEIDAELAKG